MNSAGHSCSVQCGPDTYPETPVVHSQSPPNNIINIRRRAAARARTDSNLAARGQPAGLRFYLQACYQQLCRV